MQHSFYFEALQHLNRSTRIGNVAVSVANNADLHKEVLYNPGGYLRAFNNFTRDNFVESNQIETDKL